MGNIKNDKMIKKLIQMAKLGSEIYLIINPGQDEKIINELQASGVFLRRLSIDKEIANNFIIVNEQ